MPVYAEAQCCFKSFALRSCQCGRKTPYGPEFWSLDLPSARVNFLSRVPALLAKGSVKVLSKMSGQKQALWLLYMTFWLPSLKNLRPTAKSRVICLWENRTLHAYFRKHLCFHQLKKKVSQSIGNDKPCLQYRLLSHIDIFTDIDAFKC